MRVLSIPLAVLATLFSLFIPAVHAANIGTVVPVVGAVADLVYDPARNLVYLANASRNEVDIYSVAEKKLIGSIPTGTTPSSLALSPSLNTLYTANIGSNTISVIDLNSRLRGNDFTL